MSAPAREENPRPAEESFAIPSVSREYDLLRSIDRGGYGEVFLARTVTGIFRAVKVVYRKNFREARPYEREFEGTRKFEPISFSHPGLLSILHVGPESPSAYFYYVMELADDVVSGQVITPATYQPKTLKRELSDRGQLPFAECLQTGIALTQAVGCLHQHHLVHRDVKPANIIFVHGQPKLGDIGLVTDVGEAVTVNGTPGYIPPEGPGKPTADIYSLGIVLFEMVTGLAATRVNELPAFYAKETDPARRKFCEVIQSCCAFNPGKRFQSTDQILEQLLTLQPPLPAQGAFVSAAARPRAVAMVRLATAQPDAQLAAWLQTVLAGRRCAVWSNRHHHIGVEWAREAEKTIAAADLAVILLSRESSTSELIAYEVEVAREAARAHSGKPGLLLVRVQFNEDLPSTVAGALQDAPEFAWTGTGDNERLLQQILDILGREGRAAARPKLENASGPVSLDSPFYVIRPADHELRESIGLASSIVLVKGARQMGKTSLLARGLQQAREEGLKVLFTDYQKLNAANFETLAQFYHALGDSIASQLDLEKLPHDIWDPARPDNSNFERFLRREVLADTVVPLVWAMDEVDRIFGCSFSSDIFGLFRSWHNDRQCDPASPFHKLTLIIAHATEPHLFIRDLDQSPFNVGTRLALQDFTLKQVSDLNELYGRPLRTEAELARFVKLVGGQPYLVRRGLNELVNKQMSLSTFELEAAHDDGIYGDHLRRNLAALARDPALLEVVRVVLRGGNCPDAETFYRLRSSGIIVGDSPAQVQLRCEIYAMQLQRHLL